MSYTAKTMWLIGCSVFSVGGVATLLDAFGVDFGYVALTTGVVLVVALVVSYFYARKINKMARDLFQLQTIVAEIPTPLMVIDREHTIQFINKAGASVGGTTPETLIGKKCYNLFNTDDCPTNCSTGNCACTRAMNQGGVVTSQTVARPGKDQEVSIMYSGVALKNQKGEITGAAEYVVDISAIAKKITGSQEAARAASESISRHVSNFSDMSNNMEKISSVMSDNAANVATMAEEMSVNMADVSSALEQAQSNVTNIAGSTEEMTSTVAEIAKSAEHARSITCSAVESVSTAEGRVDHLGEASTEIASVVDTIIDIAEQTKLLSLNATIEAARAGEAGKGFAVVASEVKELAKQTNEASIDIQDKIRRISASANDSISDIKDIGKVMEEIDNVVTMIASAVEEQSITTREISGNIKQAADSMGDISGRVSQSSDASREIADNITHVTGEITQIKETSGTLIAGCRDLSEASDTLVKASSES